MIRRPRTPAHQQSLLYISMALVVAFADFAAAQTVESPFSALEAAVVRNPYPSARTGGSYMHNFYLPLVASTPWRPSFSPDGQWIAFSMAGSIWKVRVDGDVAYELTSGATYDSSPVWSQDGRWIAYTADDRYLRINLMALEVVTGRTVALAQGDDLNLDPTWSPDGSKVVYVTASPSGSYNLAALPDGTVGTSERLTVDHVYPRARLYFGS